MSSPLPNESISSGFHHYSLVDYLGIAFHAPVSILGSLANLLFIYCILCKTPNQLRTYSVLLFHDGMSNLTGCVMGFFTMIRCIPTGFVLSFVYHGPCSYFGSTVCYYATSVLLHCSAHTQFILVTSFSYRLYVLKRPTPKLWSVIAVTTLTYMPSLFQCITYTWAESDSNVIKSILHETLGYDLTDYTLAGNSDIRNPWALFMILYLTMPFFPTSVVVLLLRRKILQSLKENENEMSPKTIAIHKQLTMALSIQACLPALLVIAAVTYGTMQLRIYHSVVQEDLVFVSHLLVPTISPIVIIYFMKSYRQCLTSLFGSTKIAVYTLTRTKVSIAPQPSTAVTTSSDHNNLA